MSKTLVITQSNYLPWRGYFDLIQCADEFVLLDCVQFTRRSWRNRNVIKTPSGTMWLTVPVRSKGRYDQSIDEVLVSDEDWVRRHLNAVFLNYKRAHYFEENSIWFTQLLDSLTRERHLSRINEVLIGGICGRLDIRRPIKSCCSLIDRDELLTMDATERLVALCIEAGATRYLSGPTAQAYLNVEQFERHGIEVVWKSYDGYPDYPQLWQGFEPNVSIIDLLFNTGPDARLLLAQRPNKGAISQ